MPRRSPTLDYLYGLQALGIKPGLARIELLLSLLGNPEKKYPTVIVAGTNGKGSTSAMIASVLQEAGFKVGHYSSPHLIRFNERIRVSGVEITNREISTLTRRMRTIAEKIRIKKDRPSFFEFTTAMAFEHFKKKKVDIAVLEVGMGGRFDATNVTTPLVSVITSIGLDHCEYLGDTIEEVAGEKAGVIRAGGVFVTTASDKAALRVIRKVAKATSSTGHYLGKDFSLQKGSSPGSISYKSESLSLSRLSLGLKAAYQGENAGAAIKTIELLREAGFKISRSALRGGLKNVLWPGRFDIRRTRIKGVRLVFDSAHNKAGAQALRASLKEITSYKKISFVIGMMADKDIDAILSVLLPGAGAVTVTQPATERSAGLDLLAAQAKRLGSEVVEVAQVGEAVAAALHGASPGSLVCVTGSIFTVGEALESSLICRLIR